MPVYYKVIKVSFTNLLFFFRKSVQVAVNVCNRFVISTVSEPPIAGKIKQKRIFLCYTAYNPKTIRIFAVLIKKTRCKTALQNVEGKKRGNKL